MRFCVIFLIALFSPSLYAQNITDVKNITPNAEYDNIHIQRLDGDNSSTSFVIWIKKNVKSHKHESHAEVIYIIEGNGNMIIGEKKHKIKPNDYFRIPKNTFHSLEVTSKNPIKVISIQAPAFHGKDRVFETLKNE